MVNIQTVTHVASGGNWTRTYTYDSGASPPASNRLTSTQVGFAVDTYGYDGNGNMESVPHLSVLGWDWSNRISQTATQVVNAAPPVTTYCRYDSSGQRVLKATDSGTSTRQAERVYLGPYQVYREYDTQGNVALERSSLEIHDAGRRLCLIETTTTDTSQTNPGALPVMLTRYQLDNHLASALVELDASAAVITYAEYFPFGSTSFQAGRSQAEVSQKRYRYTGKEPDPETGFSYHGARYYIPWIGRWTTVDPAGLGDGVNVYAYVRNNPVRARDPHGTQGEDGLDAGPFRLTNPSITGATGLNASFHLDLSHLFDGQIGVTSGDASGTVSASAGLDIPAAHLRGGLAAFRADLNSLHIGNGQVDASVSGRATLTSGPLSLDLGLVAAGQTRLPAFFSIPNFQRDLAAMAADFSGWASVRGRVSALGITVGRFHLTAEAEGTEGTLGLDASVGPFGLISAHGAGTFQGGDYQISGRVGLTVPGAIGRGTFTLDNRQGFTLGLHYFGPQFGPFGLMPTIDPYSRMRPGNMTASPGDTPDAFQREAPDNPSPGPSVSTTMFETGPSLGYSHFSVRGSSYLMFSVGVALPKLTTYTPDEAPLPSVMGAVPGLDSVLYGHSSSTSMGHYGVFVGAGLSGTLPF